LASFSPEVPKSGDITKGVPGGVALKFQGIMLVFESSNSGVVQPVDREVMDEDEYDEEASEAEGDVRMLRSTKVRRGIV